LKAILTIGSNLSLSKLTQVARKEELKYKNDLIRHSMLGILAVALPVVILVQVI